MRLSPWPGLSETEPISVHQLSQLILLDLPRASAYHVTVDAPPPNGSYRCMNVGEQARATVNEEIILGDYTIYALKVDADPEISTAVYSSLTQGEGRFGWSYIKEANLHDLKRKLHGGELGLSDQEKDCYQSFLLNFKENDYVVYVNLPVWGRCTVARVTGPYTWRFEDLDFNHRFPVDKNSVKDFDRNDGSVHPALSARLKLQSRYWRIYAKEEFEALLEALKGDTFGNPRTAATNLAFLATEIRPLLTLIAERIHNTHPNYHLEQFVASALRNVPGVKEVKCQGGAGDHGADVLAIIESGLPVLGLQQQKTCVVQVKSFEGEHADTTAIDDIRRAFDYYPEAEMGLIVSTATTSSKEFEDSLEQLRKDTKKLVSHLLGADLAAFLLRFGGERL